MKEARIFHRQCGYPLHHIRKNVIPVCFTFSDVNFGSWDLVVNFLPKGLSSHWWLLHRAIISPGLQVTFLWVNHSFWISWTSTWLMWKTVYKREARYMLDSVPLSDFRTMSPTILIHFFSWSIGAILYVTGVQGGDSQF